MSNIISKKQFDAHGRNFSFWKTKIPKLVQFVYLYVNLMAC